MKQKFAWLLAKMKEELFEVIKKNLDQQPNKEATLDQTVCHVLEEDGLVRPLIFKRLFIKDSAIYVEYREADEPLMEDVTDDLILFSADVIFKIIEKIKEVENGKTTRSN